MRSRRMMAAGLCAVILVGAFAAAGAASAADTPTGLSNWFETVAEAERMAEEEAGRGAGKQMVDGPSGVDGGAPRVNVAPQPVVKQVELQRLVDERNRLIDRTQLLRALARPQNRNKAQQQKLNADLMAWLTLYLKLRAFVPTSRREPNLPVTAGTLEAAIGKRHDFGEGRILAAACHLYGGDFERARQRLDEASKFLSDHGLNVSPPGQDCCSSWLALQRPQAVKGYVETLENPKVFPPRIMTAYQSLLVGNHGWQTAEFNNAKTFYQRVVSKTEVFKKPPAASVVPMVADVALFFLAAGSEGVRDPERAERLLDRIVRGQPAADAWQVRRARAALQATKAHQAVAEGRLAEGSDLWQDAARELTACRQDSLPTLDAEIDEQLQAYREKKVWYRQRR